MSSTKVALPEWAELLIRSILVPSIPVDALLMHWLSAGQQGCLDKLTVSEGQRSHQLG